MTDSDTHSRRHEAEGLVLARVHTPALYELIETLSRRVNGPRVRALALNGQAGAELVALQRRGPWLRPHCHLVIGLPLFVALTRAQFRALMAQVLAGGRDGADADQIAARATRRHDHAAALLRLHVTRRFLEERFYPQLLADTRRCGVAPAGMHLRLEALLSQIPRDTRFAMWLGSALRTEFDAPGGRRRTLRERLEALGATDHATDGEFVTNTFAAGDTDARAMRYLADVPPELMLSFEKFWIDEVQQEWRERHERLKRLDERRRELDIKPRLTFAEALEHVIATAETEGDEAALQLARDLTGCRPDTVAARFVLGALLLRNNQAEGLEHIERAIQRDPELADVGCELVADFLRAHGQYETAERFHRRYGGPRLASAG